MPMNPLKSMTVLNDKSPSMAASNIKRQLKLNSKIAVNSPNPVTTRTNSITPSNAVPTNDMQNKLSMYLRAKINNARNASMNETSTPRALSTFNR